MSTKRITLAVVGLGVLVGKVPGPDRVAEHDRQRQHHDRRQEVVDQGDQAPVVGEFHHDKSDRQDQTE